ncbi:sorbitol utilization SOU2 [Fusarium mexicanum]|uniref:Sorbitol utilization SOU2 n=1 Tax=Fusarium mexicanum TaxID=751941 RepID=A0A8H5MS94_9HYPO|nr:sorbitol utilization SOU2 [Fusarium mexicanum]
MPLFSLAGKTAIVCGAGQGIGLAVAKALAEAEAEDIERIYKVKCRAYKVDVTSYKEVDETMAKAIRDLNGRLDVFVANSGVSWGDEAFIDSDIGRYHDLVKISTDGVIYCAHAAGKHFRRQKQEGTTIDGSKLDNFESGSFIATASMSGHIVNIPRRQAVYNASKATLIHMCKYPDDVSSASLTNGVSPGFINTGISGPIAEEIMSAIMDKVPMGRFGETVELKGVYLFLASDASTYVTGTDILVDGGYTAP